MNYYQLCCTLIAVIIAIAIHIDPVVNYIFTHPIDYLNRLRFALWYMLVTSRNIMVPHMRFLPVESIIFYSELLEEYHATFPELFDGSDNE